MKSGPTFAAASCATGDKGPHQAGRDRRLADAGVRTGDDDAGPEASHRLASSH
jgi:hypothetical protein